MRSRVRLFQSLALFYCPLDENINYLIYYHYLARSERFELPTLRFEV